MHLYLIKWGTIDSKRKPLKFNILKTEHVWAGGTDEARAWGIAQNPRRIVQAEEVVGAFQTTDLEIYGVRQGDIL